MVKDGVVELFPGNQDIHGDVAKSVAGEEKTRLILKDANQSAFVEFPNCSHFYNY